jgi:hypothetical protein
LRTGADSAAFFGKISAVCLRLKEFLRKNSFLQGKDGKIELHSGEKHDMMAKTQTFGHRRTAE